DEKTALELFGARRGHGGDETGEWPGDAPSPAPEHPIPDDTAHPGDLPATARNGQSQRVPSTPANSTNTPGPLPSGSLIPQSPDD
ncbi:hypothetical protein KC219_25310, partial [Mycobacterium tuberculosis]|nr:hypothetical protein [Mycobacterium tuberculosis]